MAATHRFPLWRIPDWFPERIGARFPQFRVVHLASYENVHLEIADAEIYFGFLLPPANFALAQQLRWIHVSAAGVDQILYPEMVASPVIVTNSSSVMAEPVAEYIIALMLALAKRLPSAMRYQRESQWAQTDVALEEPTMQELQDATLGIVGLGAIGTRLVELARAFGMRVIAVKQNVHRPEGLRHKVDRVWPPSALREMLAEADYVVLAAPQTSSTARMMGAAEFAAMKPTAYFINVARGALVDEAALCEALETRRIAGAAADVFDPEPLPPESPLWKAPNMLVTPHLAATTGQLWRRHAELFEDNLSRYLDGRPLRNLIDKKAGY